MTATGANGGEPIPPGGAVLQATGSLAAKLQAEAPVGTRARDAADPAAGLDGRHGRARRRPAPRAERRAGLPLARGLHERPGDGAHAARRRRPARRRAHDPRRGRRRPARLQRRPHSFELGQTMARLGAVTAAARRGGRRRDRRVRRAAAQPAERPAASARSRKRCSCSTSASMRAPPPLAASRPASPGKTAEPLTLQARAAVARDRAADRPRRRRARARGERAARPGLVPVHVLRRSTSKGRGTGTSPRPTT